MAHTHAVITAYAIYVVKYTKQNSLFSEFARLLDYKAEQ